MAFVSSPARLAHFPRPRNLGRPASKPGCRSAMTSMAVCTRAGCSTLQVRSSRGSGHQPTLILCQGGGPCMEGIYNGMCQTVLVLRRERQRRSSQRHRVHRRLRCRVRSAPQGLDTIWTAIVTPGLQYGPEVYMKDNTHAGGQPLRQLEPVCNGGSTKGTRVIPRRQRR